MEQDELTDRQSRLKDAVVEATGGWDDKHELWLRLDADSFEAYASFATFAWEKDGLGTRDKAIIQVSLAACVPYLHRERMRAAIRTALDHGASVSQIRETLEIVSVIGAHTIVEGVPILEEMTSLAERDADGAEMDRVRDLFEQERGYWSELWETVLRMDHEYLEQFTTASSHPWNRGSLDPKIYEFIYITIDMCASHLYTDGAAIHLQNAIDHGAEPAELLELLELISVQGYDSMLEGVPILVDEARKRDLL